MPLDSAFEAAPSIAADVICLTPPPVVLEFVHPLTKEVTRVEGPYGATIAEMLAAARINPRRWGAGWCTIEDARRTEEPAYIERAHWHRVRPRAGTITTVSLWPGRGGGGGGGKNILGVILSLVIVVAAIAGAYFLGPLIAPLLGITSATGIAAVSAATAAILSAVGNLILSALIPPPKPRTPEERLQGLAEDRAGFFLQATGNRARPYQPIALHLGKLKRYADVGAEWFTEVAGNDQYLRGFLLWGLGPLKVSEIKIGETPLGDYDGVEVRTVEGWPDDGPPTIFADDPHTDGLSIQLTSAAGWQTRETIDGTQEIQVEIAFPGGLANIAGNGSILSWTVEFDAEIAPAGTENWAAIAWLNSSETGFGTAGKIFCTDATRTGQPRRVGRFKPAAAGKYRVRVKRVTAENLGVGVIDTALWAALKSIKYTLPIAAHLVGKLAYTELRIKATGQLNGVIEQLNAIVESYVRLFDASGYLGSWTVPRTNWAVSRNNAELVAHVLGHWSAKKPIAATRINWLNLVEWRGACAAPAQDGAAKWMYDRVFDNASTLGAIADEVASAGRARRGMVAGKHGVIRDLPQTIPAQHFTPRNSTGFRTDIVFRTRLHAVRVRYNKDGLGQEGEITVYDDGYTAANATEIETAEAIGYTREGQVWRDWRYWLAVQRLRPHSYDLGADPEYLKAGRGALVRATHDVVGWGTASGRIAGFTVDGGGNFLTVVLDTAVTMEAGKSYGIRIRNPAGSFAATVVTVAGGRTTLTFAQAQPPGWAINANDGDRDLFGFGEAGKESVELVVKGVAPAPGLNATLKLVDAAPGVHTADTGAIPAFDPQITLPPPDARRPERPVIRSIKSDESVMVQRVGGALAVRILAEFNPPSGLPVPAHIQARWRPTAASPWSQGSLQPAAGLTYAAEPVTQGTAYRIEFRYVTDLGAASDWSGDNHTVVGKTTKPPKPTSLVLETDHFVWAYDAPPLDVTHGGGFRLRYHYGTNQEWGSAIQPHDGLLSDTRFPRSMAPPGTLTVMVKAVDADGNESDQPAVLVKDIAGPALENVLVTRDYEAEGFPGTIAGGAVAGSDIAATGQALFYSPPDAIFWSADADVFWADDYAELSYGFSFVPNAGDLPGRLTLEHTLQGVPRHIEYLADNGELFWSADADIFWSADADLFYGAADWREWPGFLDLAQRFQQDLRIRAGGGPSQGIVDKLKAKLDVPDVAEDLVNIAIGAGGTAVPVTKTYRQFVHVGLTLLDDGGAARSARVKTALPSATAPVIECLNSSGALTAGRVNAVPVQGY